MEGAAKSLLRPKAGIAANPKASNPAMKRVRAVSSRSLVLITRQDTATKACLEKFYTAVPPLPSEPDSNAARALPILRVRHTAMSNHTGT